MDGPVAPPSLSGHSLTDNLGKDCAGWLNPIGRWEKYLSAAEVVLPKDRGILLDIIERYYQIEQKDPPEHVRVAIRRLIRAIASALRVGPNEPIDQTRTYSMPLQTGMTQIQEQQFVVGQRFRLSELGRERCPRLARKVGSIITIRENLASVIVRFDGNKTKATIHRDYIEPT